MANLKISQLTGASTPLAGTEVLPIVQSSTTKKVAVSDLTAGRAVSMASAAVTGAFTADTNILYVDAVNHRLGVGTSTPGTRVEMYAPPGTSSDFVMRLRATDSGASYGSVVDLKTTATGSQVADYIVATRDGTNISDTLRCTGTGDVKAERGNFVQGTAAKGVNFTANTPAAGMTSQLLNWYEEGTFTPTYTSTGTPPTVTYSHQYGKYTRIGRQVFFTIEIGTNSATAGTGLLAVGGLPFTAVNDRYTGTFSVGYADNFTTGAPSGGYVFANETIARLTYEVSATSKTEMLTTFLTNGAGKNYLVISGSYIV